LVAGIVGYTNKVSYKFMMQEIGENLKSVTTAILILLMVGSLSGTWLLSGVIPTMIHYGLEMLNPSFFLPVSVIIAAIISVATGSSWTTTATIGIALIAIGQDMGISPSIIAGAVISGAYFGDKMSPLSDTTNLAPAMAGAQLISHIKYMAYTTVPTFIITLIAFSIINLNINYAATSIEAESLQNALKAFHIHPLLLMVPVIVIICIIRKINPLIALFIGTVLGAIFALIFQPQLVAEIAMNKGIATNSNEGLRLSAINAYKGTMLAITQDISIDTGNPSMNDLFTSGGMKGMLNTIWLIICAMIFGGVMDAIGALRKISSSLLKVAKSTFGLFASTLGSSLAINITASDQYLAIVVPGKMYQQAFKDKGLAPENLSRTLEDGGTVTSVLVPWNTCGAYQSSVLGVNVSDYFIYAIFNWLSPIMTLIFAAFSIKIKQLTKVNNDN
jgi:NhaC family Na+:H+ antiporter